MTTQTEATYIQGVLHPDVPLPLPDGSRVSLQVQSPIPGKPGSGADAFEDLEEYLKKYPINSGGMKFNREDLYDCG